VAQRPGLHLAFVLGTIAAWLAYVLLRWKADPSVLARWGFSFRGLASGFLEFGPVALAALTACVLWGLLRGTAVWNLRLAGLLVLYPFWGLVQQFLVVALLARNLWETGWGKKRRSAAVAVAVLLFTLVHLPSLPLAGLALVLGVYCTVSYLRTSNLWLLGLFHGWFATMVYMFVLEQDPWTDVISAALTGRVP
jgi:membrane protease YdiL (CAAX protease family)